MSGFFLALRQVWLEFLIMYMIVVLGLSAFISYACCNYYPPDPSLGAPAETAAYPTERRMYAAIAAEFY